MPSSAGELRDLAGLLAPEVAEADAMVEDRRDLALRMIDFDDTMGRARGQHVHVDYRYQGWAGCLINSLLVARDLGDKDVERAAIDRFNSGLLVPHLDRMVDVREVAAPLLRSRERLLRTSIPIDRTIL